MDIIKDMEDASIFNEVFPDEVLLETDDDFFSSEDGRMNITIRPSHTLDLGEERLLQRQIIKIISDEQ